MTSRSEFPFHVSALLCATVASTCMSTQAAAETQSKATNRVVLVQESACENNEIPRFTSIEIMNVPNGSRYRSEKTTTNDSRRLDEKENHRTLTEKQVTVLYEGIRKSELTTESPAAQLGLTPESVTRSLCSSRRNERHFDMLQQNNLSINAQDIDVGFDFCMSQVSIGPVAIVGVVLNGPEKISVAGSAESPLFIEFGGRKWKSHSAELMKTFPISNAYRSSRLLKLINDEDFLNAVVKGTLARNKMSPSPDNFR